MRKRKGVWTSDTVQQFYLTKFDPDILDCIRQKIDEKEKGCLSEKSDRLNKLMSG